MGGGFLDGRLPIISSDIPVELVMIIKKEDRIFNLLGDHIGLTVSHKSLWITNPDMDEVAAPGHLIFPAPS